MYKNETVMWLDDQGDDGSNNYNNCLVDTFQFTGDWQCVGPGKDNKGNGIFSWLNGYSRKKP